MNASRMWLALPAAWLALATTTAAPVPVGTPESQGPVSDGLRVRGKVPATAPPSAMKLTVRGDAIEVARTNMQYVQQTRTEVVEVVEYVQQTVQKGGKEVVQTVAVKKLVPRTVTVTVPVMTMQMQSVTVKDVKVFTVGRDGKLEPVEPAKAAALLKERPVLTGDSAEVDPRHLELVKPGTVYVVFPPAATGPPPIPPQPRP
jgi:hypothetical protein